LDEYCIIAAERKKRPSDFEKGKLKRGEPKDCAFCPGNEEMTPPAEAVYTDDGVLTDGAERVRNWKARAFPNLFAVMVPYPTLPTAEWIALPGHGYHEMVVDSPDHDSSPANFSIDQMKLMLQVYTDRYSHYRVMRGVNYVSIFKNWGEASGASLSHTHSQIIAVPIMPPLIKREKSALSAASFCPYCNIVEREMASNRLIAKSDSWILIAPFCSQAPYETWIIPREHISSLEEMSENQCKDLASVLRNGLSRLASIMDDPPYNYMIFQLPSNYHLNIRIQPALTKIAGFERSTGIYINSVPPEQAASELRME
jgi:UDPglucose--hexose-1-phosphate uridylyltransferase